MKLFKVFKRSIRFFLAVIFLLQIYLTFNPSIGAEFDPFEATEPALSPNDYYDQRGAPDINVQTECPDDGECYDIIVNQKREVIATFDTDSSLSAIATTRYLDLAYLLVSETYDCGEEDEDTCSKTLLYDHKGNKQSISVGWDESQALDVLVTKDGRFAVLNPNGLSIWGTTNNRLKTVRLSESLVLGRLQANLYGDLAVIGVSSNDQVWLGDRNSWKRTNLTLPTRGDREGILAAYPVPGGTAGAVYVYNNEFRKGLYLLRTQNTSGPIFLSSERNVGWDPELYFKDGQYYLSALDSTNERRVQIRVPPEQLVETTWPEPNAEKFPRGNYTSANAGSGIMTRFWQANSKVEDNETVFTEVDYNIDRSLLRFARFQGRVGSTRLVLSYLEQLAQDQVEKEAGQTASEGVQHLLGMVEFEDFFASSSSLRLEYRRSKTEGLASITHRNKSNETKAFSVEFHEYRLLNTRERGKYVGLEYTDYDLPSAVGFSDKAGRIDYSDYDPEFGFQTVSLIGGYDPRSYAKRYETDYSEWFFSGEGGLGLGKAQLSDSIKNTAKTVTGKSQISTPLYIAAEASLETGYLWQRRSLLLGGMGVQSLAGYRANGTYMAAGRDEDSDTNGLVLEFDRYDIWHGPFVEVNIIF